MVISGKTKTGFEYQIDSRVVTDMRFVDMVAVIQKGGEGALSGISGLLPYLFGDRKADLYKHCADEDGYVSVEKIAEELKDIFEALSLNDTTKN